MLIVNTCSAQNAHIDMSWEIRTNHMIVVVICQAHMFGNVLLWDVVAQHLNKYSIQMNKENY
jgi:TRAP-type C4-dicarboxylate transport system permease large subunit